ncbi:unnamed protein product [Nippostrongylus brasiliensis]|uniref:Protein kinase domain-containing protein n=1 Tax=Nippostrongylus brasiliensis TaxID=27835 RepID=A0A0N4XRZ3_NIPBR|nr:unnamed protein product [Nippostrongylus brasiliensis]
MCFQCGFLHRDIKPPNFAIGREEDNTNHTIYILDFGLCRRYRTMEKDLRYMREKAAFRGTTRYASIGALEMKEQSRRDDVEAWWYMILEWMIGQLPWKHCRVRCLKKILAESKRDALFRVRIEQKLKCTNNNFVSSQI